jgi:hypothetical protein
MLTHFIVNDLPEEFGEINVISGHQNLKDAQFFIDILKGTMLKILIQSSTIQL